MKIRVVRFLCFLIVVCIAPRASLGSDAREFYNQGIEKFNSQKYSEAAVAFRKAYELKPSWKIWFNIGQSEAAARRFGLAWEAFEAYLLGGGDEIPAERSDYVLKEISRMKILVGLVTVNAPAEHEVHVDGAKRGVTPLPGPVRISAGNREVALIRNGKEIARKSFYVIGGRQSKIDFEIMDKKAPPPPPVIEPETKPAEEPVQETEPAEEAAEEPEEEPSAEDEGLDPLYVWIGIGATGAAAAATVGLLVVTNNKRDEYEEERTDVSLKDETETLQAASIGILAVTCAFAVTTGVLAIFTDWGQLTESEDETSSARLLPDINGGGAGARLVLTW